MNNIEEDIKIVEEMLKDKEEIIKYHSWIGSNAIQSIENIINAYKKIKLEYEQVQAYILANGIDENLKTAIQIKTENQAEYLCLGKIKRLEEQIEYLKSNSINKDKVKRIFETKIHNTKYLASIDYFEEQKIIDIRVAEILEIILNELLEDK